ncbi:MAG: hypothetical protein Q4F65_06605 [Propionibacteriaceae bacterium]|nr:hypothetical protein [Propionibacteriaceae bacterium]
MLAAFLPLVYLGIPAARGALGIARNDDWTYYRSLFTLVETGQFQADPFARASMVGQLVVAAPLVQVFGHNIALLQVMGALAATLAAVVLHLVARRFLGWFPATVVTLTFALSPVLAAIAATFMTDLGSLILQILAVSAGAVALRGRRLRWGWWLLAAVLGLWAFTIREYAVAAVVALGVAALWTRWRSDPPRIVVGAIAVMLAAFGLCIAFFLWRTGLPNAGVPGRVAQGDPLFIAVQVVRAFFSLSLFVAPAAALAGGRAWAFGRRHTLAAVLLTLAVAALWWWAKFDTQGLLLVNYVSVLGPYAETLAGPPPIVFDLDAWLAVEVVSGLSALVVSLTAASALSVGLARGRSALGGGRLDHATTTLGHRTAVVCGIHGAMVLLVTVSATVATDAPMFDRYLVAAVPGVSAALAYCGRGAAAWAPAARGVLRAVAVAVTCGHLVLALAIADAAATLDGAKWELGRRTVAAGVPAVEVDAGYEWWGMHQAGAITGNHFVVDDEVSLWTSLFDDPRVCARGQYWTPDVPAEEIIAEVSATTWFGFTHRLVARDRQGAELCP